MSNERVSIDQLASTIVDTLKEYTEEVEEGLEDAKEEVAKDGANTLKSTSPFRFGKYAGSWRAKKVGKAWVIHNAKHYRRTHLLEKGYAKVNGDRVAGRPHIAPVEEQVIKEYERKVEKVVKG